jgi:16S rRNA G966 N2-methylase RsmD
MKFVTKTRRPWREEEEKETMIQIPFPDKKYQIIYADPPWNVKAGPVWNSGGG